MVPLSPTATLEHSTLGQDGEAGEATLPQQFQLAQASRPFSDLRSHPTFPGSCWIALPRDISC